jgi:hypothetical protein
MITTTETEVVDANELHILQCATMFFSIIRLWKNLYDGSSIWASYKVSLNGEIIATFNVAQRPEDIRLNEGRAPRILNLDIRERQAASFTFRPLYTVGKISWRP